MVIIIIMKVIIIIIIIMITKGIEQECSAMFYRWLLMGL